MRLNLVIKKFIHNQESKIDIGHLEVILEYFYIFPLAALAEKSGKTMENSVVLLIYKFEVVSRLQGRVSPKGHDGMQWGMQAYTVDWRHWHNS